MKTVCATMGGSDAVLETPADPYTTGVDPAMLPTPNLFDPARAGNAAPKWPEGFLVREKTKRLFWNKVARAGPDDCWLWTGELSEKGYGNFACGGRAHKRKLRAHRIVFFYTHGRFPNEGRHSCDNPPCCNPAHILDGTHRDNMRDCIERGRFPSGTRCGKAKLTREQIALILADNRSSRKIAKDYGVAKSTIGTLKRGESYLEER